MPRVYELPTHLQVEDNLLLGLTARQLVRAAVGASLAYEVWDVSSALPSGLRLALTACLVVTGLLLALLQPGGRPLDQWVFAFMVFAILPQRRIWRASTPSAAWTAPKREGWAQLAPEPDWIGADQEPSADRDPSTSWALR
jgi:hypothetical protein